MATPEEVRQLLSKVQNKELPEEERVEAGKKIFEIWENARAGKETDEVYKELFDSEIRPMLDFITAFSLQTLRQELDRGIFADKTEEIMAKAAWEHTNEVKKQRFREMPIAELARVYTDPDIDSTTRSIAGQILGDRKEELEFERTVKEVIEIDWEKKRVPQITSPSQAEFGSEAQIRAIGEPTKRWARYYLENGQWNSAWGDPSEYLDEQTVKRILKKVGKVLNKDFAEVAMEHGIWLDKWGNQERFL